MAATPPSAHHAAGRMTRSVAPSSAGGKGLVGRLTTGIRS